MAKAAIKALFGNDFKTDNIVYVAKNGNDSNLGTIVEPFLTIEAANNYAIANRPSWPVRIVVSVAPGSYEEHITDAYYRVYIVGAYGISDEKVKSVIIRNTGADEAHWPIATVKRLNLVGISVETSDAAGDPIDGVLGEVSEGSFQFCKFNAGHFIEQNEQNIYMNFNFCSINGGAFQLSGSTTYDRYIALRNCEITSSSMDLTSTGGTKVIKFERCIVESDLNIGGDWGTHCNYSESYGTGKFTFNTNGFIDIYSNTLVNGIHFTKDTPALKRLVNNYFKDCPAGGTDITAEAGVSISIVDYRGNKQCQGLGSCLQITGGQRTVGGNKKDRYKDIQTAIDSIPAGEVGVINLYENVTDQAKLVLGAGSKITIRSQKTFRIDFTSDIVELGDNQELNFHEMSSVNGGNMEINGTSAILSFEGCLTISGYITSTSGVGSMVIVYFSSLVGITGHPVLTINNTDTLHVIGYSRVKGITGQSAIKYLVDSDNKLKIKFSTLFHGDGGTNRPITYTGTDKIDFAMYNSAINTALDASKFNNIVGSPNNTTSPEIDF